MNKKHIIEKHEQMNTQLKKLKDGMRFVDDLRIKQMEEHRKLIEEKKGNSPYQEMKNKHLNQAALMPDLAQLVKDGKDKQPKLEIRKKFVWFC